MNNAKWWRNLALSAAVCSGFAGWLGSSTWPGITEGASDNRRSVTPVVELISQDSSSKPSNAAEPLNAAGADEIDFNRDIRPILSENCFACHGPDATQRAADLRLDLRAEAVAGGALDETDPRDGTMSQRIHSDDPSEIMPPPESRKKLSPRQLELLDRWLAAGAPYQTHWAYLPPTPKDAHESWDTLDRLIERELTNQGLTPTGLASPEVLVRRLYLDLIGLPPTPAQQQAFLQDTAPNRWEKLIDQLLASPHFGERMATPWLDVVRYADTVGYHGDQNQNVFPYRDWVVKAFNDNLPFDEFTRYQLAGDLFENPTTEQLIASCFNRLNMMTREGGAQPEEYLAKYAADRVRTIGGAWLGATVGCAECHDHKYDPITTKDFYSLAAFFADLRQWGVYHDYGYTPNPDLRGWSNDHPFPPEIDVPVPYLLERQQRLMEARDEWLLQVAQEVAEESDQLRTWHESLSSYLESHPSGWTPCVPIDGTLNGLKWEAEQQVLWHEAAPGAETHFQIAPPPGTVWAIRWELLGDEEDSTRIFPHGTAQLNLSIEFAAGAGTPGTAAKFWGAEATHKLPRYASTFEIPGILGAWRVSADAPRGTAGVWVLTQPWQIRGDERVTFKLQGNRSRRLRISLSPLLPELYPEIRSVSAEERREVLEASSPQALLQRPFWARQWLAARSEAAANAGIAELRTQDLAIRDCRQGRWPVQISQAQTPRVTRVLNRGDWQDQTGEIVEPAFPAFLEQEPAEVPTSTLPPRRLTRMDLANWLVAPANPLTARVQVNRLWKQLFGVGLSPVLDDFGLQGQYPTHPELLDWLAWQFQHHGWDYKRMVKLIVMSQAYQRDSRPTPAARERDPKNLWLSHQNARRLDAEFIRDQALAISGLLVPDLGGPPVFPYQPDNYYEHLQFPDRKYRASWDDRQYRRGLYTHWQRTFLHPMLANFDAPAREECTGQRTEANTPLQALTLLNDPSFVEAARCLAINVCESEADPSARWSQLFRAVLAREPRVAELESLAAFLEQQRARFAADPDSARELLGVGNAPLERPLTQLSTAQITEWAAWTSAARALLNLHETLTRY